MSRWLHFGLILVLVGVTFGAYWGALDNELVWDSHNYVLNNPYILEFSWANLKWMLSSQYFSNWHPITWLSYTLDSVLYGGVSAQGLHLSSLMLHALNSVLFYLLALKIFAHVQSHQGPEQDTRRIAAAFITALLFAVHPQHVESVAWVAERKDTLFLAFTLITFIAYFEFATRSTNRLGFYLLALVAFAFALGSKSMPVTVPALLLVFDLYPLHRVSGFSPKKWLRLALEKVPFALLSLATAWLTMAAQKPGDAPLSALSLGTRVLVAFDSTIQYVQKLLAPIHLSPLYAHPGELAVSAQTLIPVLTVVLATGLFAVLWNRGQRFWLAGWLFYLLSLIPVAGIVQVGIQAMADRYAYLPTLPFYLWFGGAASALLFSATGISRWKPAATAVGVMAVVVLCIALTIRQVEVWQSPLSVFGRVVGAYPDSGYARENLAVAYFNRGQYEQAIEQFTQAVRIGEMHIRAIPAFALSHLYVGDYPAALNIYRQLIGSQIELGMSIHCLWYNAGWAFAKLGDAEQSIWALKQVDAASLQGNNAQALVNQLEQALAADIDYPPLCVDYPRLSAENHIPG